MCRKWDESGANVCVDSRQPKCLAQRKLVDLPGISRFWACIIVLVIVLGLMHGNGPKVMAQSPSNSPVIALYDEMFFDDPGNRKGPRKIVFWSDQPHLNYHVTGIDSEDNGKLIAEYLQAFSELTGMTFAPSRQDVKLVYIITANAFKTALGEAWPLLRQTVGSDAELFDQLKSASKGEGNGLAVNNASKSRGSLNVSISIIGISGLSEPEVRAKILNFVATSILPANSIRPVRRNKFEAEVKSVFVGTTASLPIPAEDRKIIKTIYDRKSEAPLDVYQIREFLGD